MALKRKMKMRIKIDDLICLQLLTIYNIAYLKIIYKEDKIYLSCCMIYTHSAKFTISLIHSWFIFPKELNKT